jgi:hypothetical protein
MTNVAVAPPVRDRASSARLSELADYVVPFMLRAVADLRVADHLREGPRTVDELAAATGVQALPLYRALRALACRGVFSEVEPQTFALTPLAQPLRTDHPESLADAYPLLEADIRAWAGFGHSLRTGEAAFDAVHGVDYWTYMAEHPDESARFDASQQSVTKRELRTMLDSYEWSEFGTIVDVGGGNGAFLAGILKRYPGVRGIVFDQPHVVANAPAVLAEAGVAERCEVAGGSFLRRVPDGGDAYLLKRIMYAWNDEDAVRMLRTIRAAMRPSSRLLLIEPLMEPGDAFDWGKLYDVLLLAMAGGGGRSLEQLKVLFAQADLRLVRVVNTRMSPIIEARPV